MNVNKRIIALSNRLRDQGMDVSIRSTETACQVWDILKSQSNLDLLEYALKTVYVKDPSDLDKFEEVFHDLFGNKKRELDSSRSKSFSDTAVEQEDMVPAGKPGQSQQSLDEMQEDVIAPQNVPQHRVTDQELSTTNISKMDPYDQRVFDLCRKLGIKVANQRNKRRKRLNSHNVDMTRTIRTNLKNGGKLIELINSRPPKRKSRHYFLNDVSGSCDWISNWFFAIIFGCQRSFDKVTVFDFDNKIVDMTDALDANSYYNSYEIMTMKHMESRMIHGQSDMVNSFTEFLDKAYLNGRTDVIILTDCRDWTGERNNGVLKSATLLREIVHKSRRVIILNPEGKKRWNTPTSCVRDYQNVGAEVYEIGTLDHLSRLLTKL
jgi:uncharacterized protein with von Willebrand factor type A (vWA) domain